MTCLLQQPVSISFDSPISIPHDVVERMSIPNQFGWIQMGKFMDSVWKKMNMQENCSKIKQWEAIVLYLAWNYESKIISQISKISFPSLTKIYLFDNNIESIEMIAHASFESLQVLALYRNRITNFKALRKLNCPKLINIELHDNQAETDIEGIVCQMSAPCLKEFSSFSVGTRPMGNDSKWIVKLETETLANINVHANRRALDPKFLKNKLRDKYRALNFI